MSIALHADHVDLAEVIRGFSRDHDLRSEARARLQTGTTELPAFWPQLAQMGLLGLGVPEDFGGSGSGLLEAAVAVQELARAITPGPYLPTVMTATVLAAAGGPSAEALLPSIADGSTRAALALGGGVQARDGRLHGATAPFLGAGEADWLVVEADGLLVVVDAAREGVSIEVPANTDPTRPAGVATLLAVPYTEVDVLSVSTGHALAVARTLAAADAAGVARQTLEDSVAYVKVREQFGRAIGSFQAVKHRCADLLLAAEEAEAAVWGAARAVDAGPEQFRLQAAAAWHTAGTAGRANAQAALQLHGGIGFTWEHDAHMFLRRALALGALLDAGAAADEVALATVGGTALTLTVDLPPEVEARREEVRQIAQGIAQLPEAERRDRFVDTGYLMPHWPEPWGLSASPGLQLLIEEELRAAGLVRPSIGVASPFLLLSLIQHGTAEQAERWVAPVLRGEEIWCQLFSEPEAGSDAAAVRTRGRKVEGGWLVNGQKVWSSHAHRARWGMATIRTDYSVPKHQGITMMVIDMEAFGVEIRPLRQITGQSDFNETFLTDVFVPDDCVIGAPGDGWAVARNTLGNERVTIGDGSGAGPTIDRIVALAAEVEESTVLTRRLGQHAARDIALRQLNFRRAQRAVAGGRPAAEGAVTKLLGGLHGQSGAMLEVDLVGSDAVAIDGPRGYGVFDVLSTQRLTIAGGTAEITRNQIAERILGLPRERTGDDSGRKP